MRSRATWWAGALVTGAWCAAACQGSSVVNDVGDVNSPHAGEAGAGVTEVGGGGGATSGTGGGAGGPSAGRGGAGGATPTVGGGSGTGGGLGAEGGSAPTGGTGGIGANGGSGIQDGGAAGSIDEQEGDCLVAPGCLFAHAPRITALATDSKRVYWAEYGAKDELGNYSHAGRVLARDFDGKNQRTLVDGLDGPMGLAVTASYLYVYLDGGRKDEQASALVRAPLDGGDAVLVLDGATPLSSGGGWCESDCVTSNGELDFFSDRGIVYSLANEAGASPEQIHDGPVGALQVDDAYLYFEKYYPDGNEMRAVLERAPLAGGSSMELEDGLNFSSPIRLVDQNIYLIEVDEDPVGDDFEYNSYLSRAPKDGSGSFLRVAHLGAYARSLTIIGERFFADDFAPAVAPDNGHHVVTGLLSDPTEIEVQPGFTKINDTARWKGSSVGVFWAIIADGQLRFSALR